jgi:alpha-glucosidase
MMVAEAYMARRPDLVDAFTRPDQFHQVFAFDLMLAPWDAAEVERAVRDTIRVLDAGVAPCWTLNNHDIQRIVTRLGRTDADDVAAWTGNNLLQSDADVDEDLGRRRALALTAFMMAMPGSVYLYQGEELGLPEVLDLPDSAREDPVFRYTNGTQLGRDGCRVPLPWTADVSTSFGFSAPATDDEPDRSPSEPWLPQPDDWGRYAVADQIDDHDSTLHLYRTLAACRRTHATPQPDELALVGAPAGVVVARRGALIVVLNTTDRDVRYRPETAATVVFATTPSDDDTIPANSTVWFAMAP